MNASLSAVIYEPVVRAALAEDLGRAGDLTTEALIDTQALADADLVVRKPGCIAGLDIALSTFSLLKGGAVEIVKKVADGEFVSPGQVLAQLHGSAQSILTAERTALNFLGHLSGIATLTRQMADRCAGHKARVVCTRKTLPGLRSLQKYAVRLGGGRNHRFGLDDAVMIKDNHIAVCGGIAAAVNRVRSHIGHMVKISVEVDRLDQLSELLTTNADVVLLDNMGLTELRQAVSMARGRIATEASGGVTLETIGDIAATGVDYISVGFITHSAPNLDVALDIRL